MKYDLEDRTKKFSVSVIKFAKMVKRTHINQNMIDQLLRSATSVGANYREANGASSKRDFKNKISICRKEIQETKYWLELLGETEKKYTKDLEKLWSEAHELTLIFNKIGSSLRKKKKSN